MRKHTGINITSTELEKLAQSGRVSDIEVIMGYLEMNASFLQCKLIDYALGLVSSEEGIECIKHFLFNGSRIQKNYAALFFKRRGANLILEEAVRLGSIDQIQAYSR